MAKHQKKAVSVLLSALMIASMCSVPTVASAANTTKEQSNAALSSYYSTNGKGVGVKKSITVDGDISDWNNSMLIAQGTANDDPRVYRDNSMYEVPIDMYAMYAAWDSDNLYLMWEMTNVQDMVAPSDDYPLSQGILYQTMNVPFFIAVDTGKSDVVGNDCQLQTGGTIWDSGITFSGNNVNRVIAISTNGANGPFVYSGNESGLNAKEIYTSSTSGIKFKYGLGILSDKVYGIDKAYGVNNNRVLGDMCSDSAAWVDFNAKGHKTSTMDFHYEMSIPLSTLGVTESDITNTGLGIMNIATMGMSGMDCLPYDLAMNDNADQPDTQSQEFNSFEKSDPDDITVPFARVGNGEIPVVPPVDPPIITPTAPPTGGGTGEVPTEAPTADSNATGQKQVTVEAGNTVTFTVDTTTDKKIGGYRVTTNYDNAGLELDTSYSTDGVSTLGAASGNEVVNTGVAGKVMSAVLAPADEPYTAANGATLQTIQFVAKKAGTYTISYVVEEMFDENESDLVVDAKPVSGVTFSEDAKVNGEAPTDPPVPSNTSGSVNATVKAGDTVEYTVDLRFDDPLYGFNTVVDFDSNVLEFASVSYPNFDGTVIDNSENAGRVAVAGVGSPTDTYDFTTSKELITIKFTAKTDATTTITYTMSEVTGTDLEPQVAHGQPLSSKVAFSNKVSVNGETPSEPVTDPLPPEQPTTSATSVSVKKGDVVNYWVEVTIPESDKTIEAWVVDMYYNKSLFQLDTSFADGKGFASGNAAVDYVLGNTTTATKLPGGNMVQANFEVDGEASFTDIALGGCGLEGNTTKLVCIQLVAKQDGKGTLSYRLRELTDEDLQPIYYDEETFQAKDGAEFDHKVKVTTTEPDYLIGDVNGDGYVTKADLSAWMAIFASKTEPNAYQLATGDLDGSGKYDLTDRMMLVRLVAG